MSIHSLPFRRRETSFHLNGQVQYCEKPVHKFKADVCYQVYAPLLSNLFISSAPKIAGLHGAVVTDLEDNPSDFFKQGPFVAGAYAFRELFGEITLRSFDAVHTVNPEGLPLRHDRVFRIPNWVDCSTLSESLRTKKRRHQTFRVVFVGKPAYNKGFDRFIALSHFFNQGDIEFVATVPPAQQYADSKSVKSLGYLPQTEMIKLYSTAGVLLHPTRKESFGLAIVEALASGTPVITTPISSHVALKLPLRYATSVTEFAKEVQDVYALWKNDHDKYVKLSEDGAKAARPYDRKILLPQFESMLKEIAH